MKLFTVTFIDAIQMKREFICEAANRASLELVMPMVIGTNGTRLVSVEEYGYPEY